MKFEEVIPFMRQGRKVRMRSDIEEGVYWICGYQSLFLDTEEARQPIIIKLQKDDTCIPDRWSWGIPVWAVMAEDWEVIE